MVAKRMYLVGAALLVFATGCGTEVHDETVSPLTHNPPLNEQTFSVRVETNEDIDGIELVVEGVGSASMSSVGSDVYEAELPVPLCAGAVNFVVEVDTGSVTTYPSSGSFSHAVTDLPPECDAFLPSFAQTFDVDTTEDFVDAQPGDGVCAGVENTACSLRAAVMEANAKPGNDLLRIDSQRYVLGLDGDESSEALDDAIGDLDVVDDLTIESVGSTATSLWDFLTESTDRSDDLTDDPQSNASFARIDADRIDRVFQVDNGATLQLRNLAVVRGRATSHGGGIHSQGTLVLNRVAVADNEVRSNGGGGGGGIYNGGTLLATDYALTQNTVEAMNPLGGGLENAGTATMKRGLVAYSDARFGSAIYNRASASLVVDNTTVYANTWTAFGNTPPANVVQNRGTTLFDYVTFAGHGGDRRLLANVDDGEMTLANALFVDNTAQLCSGTIESGAGNVADRPCALNQPFGADLDHLDVDLMLAGGLDDRGGFTPVYPISVPPPGSSAFDPRDEGIAFRVSFHDQRGEGFDRRLDGDGNGSAIPDPGAYERPAG